MSQYAQIVLLTVGCGLWGYYAYDKSIQQTYDQHNVKSTLWRRYSHTIRGTIFGFTYGLLLYAVKSYNLLGS